MKPVFHSYPDIKKIVGDYRDSCGLEEQIPVDVEKLVDVILKINVIPIPSLYRSYEIDAFISNDFKKIYVDEYLYINLESQYRFTLAHELGHMVLHQSFYRQYGIKDIASYHRYINSITEDEYTLLETQANNFAGLFLVPPGPLETHFREQAKESVARTRAEASRLREALGPGTVPDSTGGLQGRLFDRRCRPEGRNS